MQTPEVIHTIPNPGMSTARRLSESRGRSKLSLFLAATCLHGMNYPAKAGCVGVGFPRPSVVVFENESVARFTVYRDGDTNLSQSADFRTTGGNPGVDYVPVHGTVSFAAGQSYAVAEVPLLDNGRVDGTRNFAIELTNAPPGLGILWGGWGQIVDNELESVADPFFIPDARLGLTGAGYFIAGMPGGRILLAGRREGGISVVRGAEEATSLTMLEPDGRVADWFAPELPALFDGLFAVQVLEDARILVCANGPKQLVRLAPNGAMENEFSLPNFTGIALGLPGGKILAALTTNDTHQSLQRFHADGSPDASFVTVPYSGLATKLAVRPDGRILVGLQVGGKGRDPTIVQFRTDGSPDAVFNSPLRGGWINSILVRVSGKVLVTGQFHVGDSDPRNVVQLNDDGSIDIGFQMDMDPLGWQALLEIPDGGLVVARKNVQGEGTVTRHASNGNPDRLIASFRGQDGYCDTSGLTIALATDGQILLGGNVTSVGGVRCNGLARLRRDPPKREFLVTSAKFCALHGPARLRVERTGVTTNSASVSFTTRDDTARAGVDYVTTAGTLEFAPLEVSKEIMVPLLARTGVTERLWFRLELGNPTAGFSVTAPALIGILPELQITMDLLRPGPRGAVNLTLQNAVPGLYYTLEMSPDPARVDWWTTFGVRATAPTVSATVSFRLSDWTQEPGLGSRFFFRAQHW